MRRVLLGCGLLVIVGIALSNLIPAMSRAEAQPAKPLSARALGKEWRYPGLSNDATVKIEDPNWVYETWGPANQDRTSMQFAQPKADFERVWNFYAGKCGYAGKWKKDSFVLVIEKADGNSQRMVMDQTLGQRADPNGLRPEETDFGLFTDEYVVHVQIRKVNVEQTHIRILTTIR
jgi:hypothetical protein